MTVGLVYEISRYDVSGDAEVVVGRAQLLASDGALWRRVDGGTLTRCAGVDVATAIGADPSLNEVRANQVARISAEPEALAELPLVLRVPGEVEDFDPSQWSTAMQELHELGHLDRDVYRVLYLNGKRWAAWSTPDGSGCSPVALTNHQT